MTSRLLYIIENKKSEVMMRVFMDWKKTKYPKGGKQDGIVYCYYSYGNICVGRNYAPVPFMKQNANIISIEKITLEIWKILPQRFKNNLKIYAMKYKTLNPKLRRKHLNCYGIFLKIMHKIEKYYQFSQMKNPGYNLYLKIFGTFSVADFIKMNYLPKIKKYSQLKATLLNLKTNYIDDYKTYLDLYNFQNQMLLAPFG